MNNAVRKLMFSSKTDDWSTPQDFFDAISKKYGPFELDVCASKDNAKCQAFISESINGLYVPWREMAVKCWMNPPYGREISKWVKKAYEEGQNGCTVVCLLPARTDTKWFHEYCLRGKIEFIKGRLKFGGSKNSAPFPSMVVVFTKE